MIKKSIVLKDGYPLCSSCNGNYLRADIPKLCPYLARFISEFLEKRNSGMEDGNKWEQTRHYPEKGEGIAQCSVRYQTEIRGSGLVTVEAAFKTEYKDVSMRACSVFLKITGGPEKAIMTGLAELLSKK